MPYRHAFLGPRLRMARVVLCLLGLVWLAGCNKPRELTPERTKKPAPQAPEQPAATADTRAAAAADTPAPREAPAPAAAPDAAPEPGEATRPERSVPRNDLMEKLKKLKFHARREVMWVRTTVANIPNYQRALLKFEQEFANWDMYGKIPVGPHKEALEKSVREAVEAAGFEITYLDLKEPQLERRDLPEVIYGDKAFDFEDNDIRGILHVTLKVKAPEAPEAARLVEALQGLNRLLLVRRVKPLTDEVLVNAEGWYFTDTPYPVHKVKRRELEREMKQIGIGVSMEEAVKEDRIGYLQNAAMSYREFNASLERLNEAMGLLSKSKYLEARSAFFRRKAEEAAQATPLK